MEPSFQHGQALVSPLELKFEIEIVKNRLKV